MLCNFQPWILCYVLNRALKSPGRHDVFCVTTCRVTLVEIFKLGVSGNEHSVTFVITESPYYQPPFIFQGSSKSRAPKLDFHWDSIISPLLLLIFACFNPSLLSSSTRLLSTKRLSYIFLVLYLWKKAVMLWQKRKIQETSFISEDFFAPEC